MTTEYNTDTYTLTLGGQDFKLDEELTVQQIRSKIANIPISQKTIGDFYNPELHVFVNVADIADEAQASQLVTVLETLLQNVKLVSKDAINSIVREENNVATYDSIFLNAIAVSTIATKVIAGVLIVQNVGRQLCSINKKETTSPKLEDINKKINDIRQLLNKTTRLLFTMETIPQS